MIYGSRYEDLGNKVFNAYLVKVNSEGNITETNNIDAAQLITIKTYPNPSNGPLSLDIKGITGKADIRIFDMSGNNVYVHHGITDGATTLDLSDLVSGTYIYKVYQKNKVLCTGQWVRVE
ncbi:MAG: T9SS type A sorting domain-containing protein [Saprospiraceae bacterium]